MESGSGTGVALWPWGLRTADNAARKLTRVTGRSRICGRDVDGGTARIRGDDPLPPIKPAR